jgi:membrane-bound lytic murein transglycosylase D
MAIQSRFLGAAVSFSLFFGPGASAPGAAESLSPAMALDEAPDSPAFTSREHSPSFGERGPIDMGSAVSQENPISVVDDDPWAEAFAAGSRLPLVSPALTAAAYPVVVNPQVQYFLDRFTGSRREVVTLWVNRSGRYLTMIREVLRARGLPEDLAYTAMIESGFKPDAVSRMGAKGMWQFMAATARRYGLRVDHWVDERLDPEKSTIAAAAYLRDLYNLFGSWALAQAAYNAGEVKVARAIRSTGSSDFWKLAETRHLRPETKEFVPQIHAATVIGRDPDRYGFEFGTRESEAFDTLSVPPATDVRTLASTTGVSAQALRTLNPVLVRGITPPGAPWTLRVPIGARAAVATALTPRRASAAVAGHREKVTRTAATRADVHVVRPRETVSAIAKRYGVTVGDVLRWNRLDGHDPIRPGDRLRVAAARPSAERDGQGGFR